MIGDLIKDSRSNSRSSLRSNSRLTIFLFVLLIRPSQLFQGDLPPEDWCQAVEVQLIYQGACKFQMAHAPTTACALQLIQLPTAFPPPCLALAQESVQKSFENHAKSVRIEARGTSWGRCGALLGFPSAQRVKNIQNGSSWTALQGPSETPNLSNWADVVQMRPKTVFKT